MYIHHMHVYVYVFRTKLTNSYNSQTIKFLDQIHKLMSLKKLTNVNNQVNL